MIFRSINKGRKTPWLAEQRSFPKGQLLSSKPVSFHAVLFHRVSPAISCVHFSSPPYVPYATHISSSLTFFFSPCGAAAQRGPWPPHSWGFLITHNDASHTVGLLWTSDRLVAETSTWQHTTLTTNIHAPGGIRNHDLSWRAAADLRLRPRGYSERHRPWLIQPNMCNVHRGVQSAIHRQKKLP
jgi:hypothetical protein